MVLSAEDFYKTLELVRRRLRYEVHIKPSTHSRTKFQVDEVLLRSAIKNLKEATEFIETYETVSQSRFHILSEKSVPNSSICSRKWICNHGIVSGSNKTCTASISILVKTINNESMLQDDFLRKNPPLPAVIRINPNHNHRLMVPLPPYKMTKIRNDVKMCFYEYFKRGYFGSKAKKFHEQYLRKANFFPLKDESMNPPLRAVYTLACNWLKLRESMEIPEAPNNERVESLQAVNVKKGNKIKQLSSQNFINIDDVVTKIKKEPNNEYIISEISGNENEIEKYTSQNLENFITIDDVVAKIKKEPDDEYIITESSANEIEKSTPQNLENFINIDKIMAKIKKEPDEEYIIPELDANEILKDKPLLTIKQEAIEDDNAGLPVITSCNSLAGLFPALPVQPQVIRTSNVQKTSQNVSTTVKIVQQSPSQKVVYDSSLNKYKIIKCLSVNTGSYSASQYKSYSPNSLVPMRISLQKF